MWQTDGKTEIKKGSRTNNNKRRWVFFYNKAGNAGLLWVIRVPFLIKRHLDHTPPNWPHINSLLFLLHQELLDYIHWPGWSMLREGKTATKLTTLGKLGKGCARAANMHKFSLYRQIFDGHPDFWAHLMTGARLSKPSSTQGSTRK